MLAEQCLRIRGAGTSGREILCKLTLSQVGTSCDTVLKMLLLTILAPMLSFLDGSLAFAIPEPNKFALENELSHRFFVGPRVVQKKGGRCVWVRGKAMGLAKETLLKEGEASQFSNSCLKPGLYYDI